MFKLRSFTTISYENWPMTWLRIRGLKIFNRNSDSLIYIDGSGTYVSPKKKLKVEGSEFVLGAKTLQ